MNNFIYESPTKVFFGKGCVREYLACTIASFGENVLLAYGNGSIKQNGIYDEITKILEKAERTVTEFSDIMPNPTYEKVLEGAVLAKQYQIDVILAVGGGSVIDCCKAVALAAESKDDIWNRLLIRQGVVDFEPLLVVAVATTAGSGSEMNGGFVITNGLIKTGRDYPQCIPKFALLDPEYTYSVPYNQMTAGGFDILSHLMEAYFSYPASSNISDDIVEALMKGVIRDLGAAVKNPQDYTARSNLLWASAMAQSSTIKLGKKTDFQAHHIAHQIGAYTNCGHGCAMAVVIPAYYRHIYPYGLHKFARFAHHVWKLSPDGKTEAELALEGIEALGKFIVDLGLPATLQELGIANKAMLKPIADSCSLSPGSYKRMTHKDILQILQSC